MGLDITAYSRLRHIGKHEFDPERNEGEPGPHCYYADHVQAYAYDSFGASFRGIPILWTADGMIHGGCYEHTPETVIHEFHAGSYGGYGAWRKDLAEQLNPVEYGYDRGPTMSEPDPDKPFYELIWFADNEGSIGSEAAKDLLADFRKHAQSYAPSGSWPDRSREKYAAWTHAFELAADGGLVRFH